MQDLPQEANDSALVSAVALLMVLVAVLIKSYNKKDITKTTLAIAFHLYLLITIPIATFVLAYSLANLFVSRNFWSIFTQEFVNQEISSGLIGLRIASILAGVSLLILAIEHIASWISAETRLIPRPSFHDKEINDLSEHMAESYRDMLIIAQFGLYIFIFLWLWLFLATGVKTPAILNWAVFFIVDDWYIIRSYFSALKGRMLSLDKWRIGIFNLLLTGILLLVIWTGVGREWALGSLMIFAILFLFRYILPKQRSSDAAAVSSSTSTQPRCTSPR